LPLTAKAEGGGSQGGSNSTTTKPPAPPPPMTWAQILAALVLSGAY
jgi:hypothetical protein